MWTLPIALVADFILNLASESEEESSNDDEEIIATLATVIVRKKYKTKPARVQNYLDTVQLQCKTIPATLSYYYFKYLVTQFLTCFCSL
jgi:ADP-ribosylglycohydrolase